VTPLADSGGGGAGAALSELPGGRCEAKLVDALSGPFDELASAPDVEIEHAHECGDRLAGTSHGGEGFAALVPGLIEQIPRGFQLDDEAQMLERGIVLPRLPGLAAELEGTVADVQRASSPRGCLGARARNALR
jgi:hypothetical protein